MAIFNVDFEKARLLLKHLAISNKKIKERTQALRIIHNDITQIKRLSGKPARHKIAKLEKNIVDALRRGGFIEECKESAPTEEQTAEQKATPEAVQPPAPICDLSRDEKLKIIEERAIANAQKLGEKESNIAELNAMLNHLELIKKGIKVQGKPEREQLKQISLRVQSLKHKIQELKYAPEKNAVKKKSTAKKTLKHNKHKKK